MSEDLGHLSDGYHTFNELYEHRHTLYIMLCRLYDEYVYNGGHDVVWRSRTHSDGSRMEGWFVLGIGTRDGGQITYHLPDRLWRETSFAQTKPRAPKYDGHTSDDVLKRIRALLP